MGSVQEGRLTRIGGNKHEGPSNGTAEPDLLCEGADVEVRDGRAGSHDSLRVEVGRLVEQQKNVSITNSQLSSYHLPS